MILIIGGAYQGKYDFAVNTLNTRPEDIWNGLHEYIRDHEDESLCLDKITAWIEKHPKGVIICDEVGSGVVPTEARLREYRDRTGHIQAALAKEAESVYRVVCGIGMRIK